MAKRTLLNGLAHPLDEKDGSSLRVLSRQVSLTDGFHLG